PAVARRAARRRRACARRPHGGSSSSSSSRLLSGRDRFDDARWLEQRRFGKEPSIAARGRVDDEEAELVVGYMDRPVEADADPCPRRLARRRLRPPLAPDRAATG